MKSVQKQNKGYLSETCGVDAREYTSVSMEPSEKLFRWSSN